MSESQAVAEQFQDMEQQTHTATLGMWTFLATEVLFFGALISAYIMCRVRWQEAFREGSMELKLWIGGTNTAVLLTSSLFMALAARAAKLGANRALAVHLILTATLGATFLGLKGCEYYLEAKDQLVPGINFSTVPADQAGLPPARQHHRPQEQRLFMVFYFIMTGLHAVHMVVGIGVILTLLALTWRGYFSVEYHNPVEIAGLYWHFVDIVWVFLYPLLYLLRQP